jgi:hypothetical protein
LTNITHKRYQVGIITELNKDDPFCVTLEEAEVAALNLGVTWYDCFVGVWDMRDDAGELILIVYQNTMYRP